MRSIARRYGTSHATINRHKPHVAKSLQRAIDRRETGAGETLLDRMDRLTLRLEQMWHEVQNTGDYTLMGAIIREARATILAQQDLIERSRPAKSVGVKLNVVYVQGRLGGLSPDDFPTPTTDARALPGVVEAEVVEGS